MWPIFVSPSVCFETELIDYLKDKLGDVRGIPEILAKVPGEDLDTQYVEQLVKNPRTLTRNLERGRALTRNRQL